MKATVEVLRRMVFENAMASVGPAAETYEFLRDFREKHGRMPTSQEIMDVCGLTKAGVVFRLKILSDRGLLLKPRHYARAQEYEIPTIEEVCEGEAARMGQPGVG